MEKIEAFHEKENTSRTPMQKLGGWIEAMELWLREFCFRWESDKLSLTYKIRLVGGNAFMAGSRLCGLRCAMNF